MLKRLGPPGTLPVIPYPPRNSSSLDVSAGFSALVIVGVKPVFKFALVIVKTGQRAGKLAVPLVSDASNQAFCHSSSIACQTQRGVGSVKRELPGATSSRV